MKTGLTCQQCGQKFSNAEEYWKHWKSVNGKRLRNKKETWEIARTIQDMQQPLL